MKSRTTRTRFSRTARPARTVTHIHPYLDKKAKVASPAAATILIMANGIVHSTGFDKALIPNYTRACVDGKWYSVDHITSLDFSPFLHVWVGEGHGDMGGYVETRRVEAWESV